jgi:histidinol phosphatase-like PHP family hydrolase
MNNDFRENQRGSANTKLIVFLLIVAALGHAGYNYVPVAFNGENLKQEMHTAVLNGTSLPISTNPVEVTKGRLLKYVKDNGYPTTTTVDAKQNSGTISATVRYSQEVNILPFGLYKYNYVFDHTASPAGFLTK